MRRRFYATAPSNPQQTNPHNHIIMDDKKFIRQLKIGKKKYWANVKMHKDYGEVLYTIEKKKPDDLTPGLKQ